LNKIKKNTWSPTNGTSSGFRLVIQIEAFWRVWIVASYLVTGIGIFLPSLRVLLPQTRINLTYAMLQLEILNLEFSLTKSS
jgi:hypothetical protein